MSRCFSARGYLAVAFILAASGSAGTAHAQITAKAADLIPLPDRVLQGTVSVRNAGSADAGPFVVTVQCQKQGGGGCAEDPGMAPYNNPMYPNRLTVNVPGLKAGAVFNHALPFWKNLKWQKGNYNFIVEADPAKVVAETNEGNNIAGTVLKK